MLNIGRLRAQSAEYYLSAVAPTAAYYTAGRGEAPGRWTGSLAPGLGLHGEVDPAVFREVLAGIDPRTGGWFYSAQGSNARALARNLGRSDPATTADGRVELDAARVAARLRVSVRAARHWIAAGDLVATAVVELDPTVDRNDPDALTAGLSQLVAERAMVWPSSPFLFTRPATPAEGRRGPLARVTTEAELERFAARRSDPALARAGFDVVFRPPKSYSVLWAVAGPDVTTRLADVHRRAVDDALAFLEDTAALTRTTAPTTSNRRGRGRRVRAAGDGFVVAAFDHRDSRSGDPLLHTHCVIANVTSAGGRFSALDSSALYRHARTADVVYNATLRSLARAELGIEPATVRNGWADVAGFPRAVIEGMSKRSAEIAEELERAGQGDSHRSREAAALASRQSKAAKDLEATPDLHARWTAETTERYEFDQSAARSFLQRARQTERTTPQQLEGVFDRLAGPDGLTDTAATFTRGDVILALADRLPELSGPELLRTADRFLASGRVAVLTESRPGRPHAKVLDDGQFRPHLPDLIYTTPDLLDIEHRVATARWPTPPLSADAVERAITSAATLDDHQTAAVRTLTTAEGPIRCLVGYPGAGKTFTTRTIAEAWHNAGRHVVGVAVTATAADELARQAHIPTDTIAMTLADLDRHGPLPAGSLVIVDEASTVSHRDLDRVLAHAKHSESTVLLVGDPHQHAAVGPGHLFAWLTTTRTDGVAVLAGNHRQTGDTLAAERAANDAYRAGDLHAALQTRDRDGKVIRAATLPELHARIVEDWWHDHQHGATAPMLAPTNHTRAELNRHARERLAAAGLLHSSTVEAGGIELRAGDWVIARDNNRHLRDPNDWAWWLRNGTRGTVTATHPDRREVTVDFDGHTIRLPASYLEAGHLEHAYALTDYLIQGRTLRDPVNTIVDHTSTRAGVYVATTRSTAANRIYLLDTPAAIPTPVGGDRELGDPPANPSRPVGLDETADRLAREPVPAVLHQIDPHAHTAHQLAATPLAELERAEDQADLVLRQAPPDHAHRLARLERAFDDTVARARLTGNPDLARRARRIAGARDRLAAHQIARGDYLDRHADTSRLRDTLRAATTSRDVHLRLTATTTVEPDAADRPLAERRRRRDQAERDAIAADRSTLR